MKVEIPENLKADVPPTLWGRILSATPVVMAVVATMLAGLASSEMTRAQYDRALAAQQQSKAGDQWNFFQAKRLRGSLQRNTVDLLQATGELRTLDAAALKNLPDVDSPAGQQAVTFLTTAASWKLPASAELHPDIKTALAVIEDAPSDAEVAAAVSAVRRQILAEALHTAREQTRAFDMETKPVNQMVAQFEAALVKRKDPEVRDFIAARLQYTADRYEVEARLNQVIANLYELQVRQSNISATRHHMRSQRFFFGMLAAQAGVIIATFAIAARKRNLLWGIAAGAGLLAVAFAVYVYLFI